MPICQALYKVVYENADIKSTIKQMFERDLKKNLNTSAKRKKKKKPQFT